MENKAVFAIVRQLMLIVFPAIWSIFTLWGQTPPNSKKSVNTDYTYFKSGTISVIPSSHQDIAWMDSIGKCIEFRDVRMITPALERMKNNPEFKFSCIDRLNVIRRFKF